MNKTHAHTHATLQNCDLLKHKYVVPDNASYMISELQKQNVVKSKPKNISSPLLKECGALIRHSILNQARYC